MIVHLKLKKYSYITTYRRIYNSKLYFPSHLKVIKMKFKIFLFAIITKAKQQNGIETSLIVDS